MLRVIAKHENVWCAVSQTAEDFREKNARLTQHCEAIGRDPCTLERLGPFLINPVIHITPGKLKAQRRPRVSKPLERGDTSQKSKQEAAEQKPEFDTSMASQ